MEQQGLQGPRIALLIDFDNVILGVDDPPGFDVELVVNALRSRGVVVLGRAYGDWYRHNRHRRKLMEQGIELVETPAFGPIIKNSADIRIALDAFEIGMLQSHISEFCLVSGDSDFLPLIKRLQLLGKSVIVIAGNKFTSELIRRNCNEYISYENLLAESVGATEDATTLDGAFALLQRTINTMNERGQDARSSSVKQMMLQLNPVFSERSFGCSQFKQFLDKACNAGVIRLGRRDGNSGEYQVMLADDNGGHSGGETTEKPLFSDLEVAPVSRARKPAPRAPKPVPEAAPETAEIVSIEEEIANNASTVSPARRGRLRFSGRTWRSGGTSTKTTEADSKAENEQAAESAPEISAPASAPTETPIESTDSTDKSTVEAAAAVEVTTQEETETTEKPKPRTARRRKSAAPKTDKTKAEVAEDPTASAEKAEQPAAEITPEAKESTPEKTAAKPKKAPVRRRTSSRTTKKKEEATEAAPEPAAS